MSHTPGPWKTFTGTAYKLRDISPCFQVEADPQSPWWVAYVQDSPDGMGSGNARLIAAAPELLNALRAIFARQNCICQLIPFVGQEPPCETCKLGTLINKAEGKQ